MVDRKMRFYSFKILINSSHNQLSHNRSHLISHFQAYGVGWRCESYSLGIISWKVKMVVDHETDFMEMIRWENERKYLILSTTISLISRHHKIDQPWSNITSQTYGEREGYDVWFEREITTYFIFLFLSSTISLIKTSSPSHIETCSVIRLISTKPKWEMMGWNDMVVKMRWEMKN